MILDTIFSIFRPIAIIFLIIFVGLCIMLYLYQDKIIYQTVVNNIKYPENNPDPYKSPSQINLKYKDIKVKTEDGFTLYGWLVYKKEYPNKTLLYFHENAGSKYI